MHSLDKKIPALVLILLLIPILFRKLPGIGGLNFSRSGVLTPAGDQVIANSAKPLQLDPSEVKNDAQKIYDELGINMFMGLPAPYENEPGVTAVLNRYDSTNVHVLSEAYYQKFTRTLKEDLKKYHDDWMSIKVTHFPFS